MFQVIPSFGSTIISQKASIKFTIKLEATVKSNALRFILISYTLSKPLLIPNKAPLRIAKKTE